MTIVSLSLVLFCYFWVPSGLHQVSKLPNSNATFKKKLDVFAQKLEMLKEVEKPFHFIIEDCSGNSFIENPYHPEKDLQLVISHFKRNVKQNQALGLYTDDAENEVKKEKTHTNENQEPPLVTDTEELSDLLEEVHTFSTQCSECRAPAKTKMKLTDVPHFKQVVIMSMVCEACGHKSNEIKSGGGIEPKGKRIELTLLNQIDLTRDVLKSETCALEIPELELEIGSALIAGKFTTVEGLIDDIIKQLSLDNPFIQGDSASDDKISRLEKVVDSLEAFKNLHKSCRIILDDPCGNSYVQNLLAPADDPQLKVTYYERTFEQNDELGLNDMRVEDYTSDRNPSDSTNKK